VALSQASANVDLAFRLQLFTETLPLGMTCLEHREDLHESWGVCPVCNNANETLNIFSPASRCCRALESRSAADIRAWQTGFSISVAEKLGALSSDAKTRLAYSLNISGKTNVHDFALRCLLFAQRCWESRLALTPAHDRPPVG